MNRMKNMHCYLFFLFLLAGLVSCEKVFMEDDAKNDPVRIFNEIWTFADRHYSFFEEKGIDWNAVYDDYRPRVRADMNPVELFDLCAEMLYLLRDGHVNLLSSFDRSRNWQWYLDYPDNFHYPVIERHYLGGRQRYVGPLQFAYIGKDDDDERDIAYVYYGSFANPVSEGNLDLIIRNLDDAVGLIIDVRNNGGGSPTYGRNIAARFAAEKVFVGTNYVKTGPGHEDFRPESVTITPHSGLTYGGNVVVLTNRRSYSATTYFVQYMRELDNVTVIGDATGGGAGLPAFRDLANGWRVRVSSTRFYCPTGNSIEPGINPDIFQDMFIPGEDITLEHDAIIDRAIDYLRAL